MTILSVKSCSSSVSAGVSDDTDGEIQFSQVENFIFFAEFFRYADRMHDAVVTLHRQSENDVRSPL